MFLRHRIRIFNALGSATQPLFDRTWGPEKSGLHNPRFLRRACAQPRKRVNIVVFLSFFKEHPVRAGTAGPIRPGEAAALKTAKAP